MTKRLVLMAALVSAGCADDPETCESAISQFYADGCVAFDEPNRNMAVDEQTAIDQCESIESGVTEPCRRDWQTYVDCLADRDEGYSCEYCREFLYGFWASCQRDQAN